MVCLMTDVPRGVGGPLYDKSQIYSWYTRSCSQVIIPKTAIPKNGDSSELQVPILSGHAHSPDFSRT